MFLTILNAFLSVKVLIICVCTGWRGSVSVYFCHKTLPNQGLLAKMIQCYVPLTIVCVIYPNCTICYSYFIY